MDWKLELFNLFFVQNWFVLSCLFSFEYGILFKTKYYPKHKSIGKFKAAFMLSIDAHTIDLESVKGRIWTIFLPET